MVLKTQRNTLIKINMLMPSYNFFSCENLFSLFHVSVLVDQMKRVEQFEVT